MQTESHIRKTLNVDVAQFTSIIFFYCTIKHGLYEGKNILIRNAL